jgi:hypothetical protein
MKCPSCTKELNNKVDINGSYSHCSNCDTNLKIEVYDTNENDRTKKNLILLLEQSIHRYEIMIKYVHKKRNSRPWDMYVDLGFSYEDKHDYLCIYFDKNCDKCLIGKKYKTDCENTGRFNLGNVDDYSDWIRLAKKYIEEMEFLKNKLTER